MDKMSPPLERRAAVKALLANRTEDMLVVTGLGSTTWDVASLGEHDGDFYLWGAMGGASMVGLGIAFSTVSSAQEPITPGPVTTSEATTGETITTTTPPSTPETSVATPSIEGPAPLPSEEEGLPG